MAYKQLTEIKRYQIFSLKEAGFTQHFMAKSLDRAPSTISRELRRNGEAKKYDPKQAQIKAAACRHFAIKAAKITSEIEIWVK